MWKFMYRISYNYLSSAPSKNWTTSTFLALKAAYHTTGPIAFRTERLKFSPAYTFRLIGKGYICLYWVSKTKETEFVLIPLMTSYLISTL